MVSAARIEWMLTQLRQGRQVRLRLNSHVGKSVVHAEMLDHYCPSMLNHLAIELLIALRAQLASNVVVDHGHKSSEGSSRISFSLTRAPTRNVVAGTVTQTNQQNNGNDNYFDRPRRGRSPPVAPDGSNDPWHASGNSDPWSSSYAATSPAPKAPRHHGFSSQLSWDTWNRHRKMSERSAHAYSSVTPDPPSVRSPAFVATLRTGTPSLNVDYQAYGNSITDGLCDLQGVWTPIKATNLMTNRGSILVQGDIASTDMVAMHVSAYVMDVCARSAAVAHARKERVDGLLQQILNSLSEYRVEMAVLRETTLGL